MFFAKEILQEQEEPLEEPGIQKQTLWGQRWVEAYHKDIRRHLWRYSFILEHQRRIIHTMRHNILLERTPLSRLREKAAEKYSLLKRQLGEKLLKEVEKEITLFEINKCWAEYLEYIAYVQEGIHLVVIGRQNPLDEFHRLAILAFDEMMEKMDQEIVRIFLGNAITQEGINLDQEDFQSPSTTWTYLMNDSPDQFNNLAAVLKGVSTVISRPLFTVRSFLKCKGYLNEES